MWLTSSSIAPRPPWPVQGKPQGDRGQARARDRTVTFNVATMVPRTPLVAMGMIMVVVMVVKQAMVVLVGLMVLVRVGVVTG